MDKSGQYEPSRMSILSNGLRGLQQMLNLCQISIGVTIVNQGVEKLCSLPNTFLALVEPKVLLLLRYYVIKSLMLMIEPIELSYTWGSLLIILTEFIFTLPLLISAGEKVIPLIHIFQRSISRN